MVGREKQTHRARQPVFSTEDDAQPVTHLPSSSHFAVNKTSDLQREVACSAKNSNDAQTKAKYLYLF